MTVGIVLREGLLLAILVSLGLGAATLLPRPWGSVVRLAFAPALGLALGTAALSAVSFVTPLGHSLWFVLLPLAIASVGGAVQHRRLRPQPMIRREFAALVAVVLWALTIFSLPMLARQSYGPMGFGIFDAPGYGTEIFGYARNTTAHPLGVSPQDFQEPRFDHEAWGEPWDLTSRYAWGFVYQHTAGTAIPAAVTEPTKWPAWTLVNPFMAVLLATAAAGVFGLALLLFDRRGWLAGLAAMLAAGPVLLQVHVDGSMGLLAGLALVPSMLALFPWLLRYRTGAAIFTFGLLLAGLQATYPEILPIVGGTLALAWVATGTRFSAAAGSRWTALRPVVIACALSAVLSPRTTPWTVDYLARVATHRLFDLAGFVHYNMRPRYILGWLFQTRDFYTFAFANPGGVRELFWGIAIPLSGIILGTAALRRQRQLLLPAGLVVVSVLQAFAAQRSGCPYCVQRSFLVVPLVLPILIVGGAVALDWRRSGRLMGSLFLAVVLLGVGNILVKTERRAIDGAYFPSSGLAAMVRAARALPRDGTPLQLEGFDTVPLWSWADLPTSYMALREIGRRLSIVAAYNQFGGFSYPRTRPVGHPAFSPDYGWVLTRFGALDTGRETVARRGPLALQRRNRPFDVSLARGAAFDIKDQTGRPWVAPSGQHFGLDQGPLTLWVSGPSSADAWVSIRLLGPRGMAVTGPPGTRTHNLADGVVVGCLPAPAGSPLRILTLDVRPTPADYTPPAKGDPPVYRPAHSVQILELRAYDRLCPT